MATSESELLIDLIAATNKSTRATRSVSKFLLIQATALIVGLGLFWIGELFVDRRSCELGICGPNLVTGTLAALVIVAGAVWAAVEGWSELKLSEVSPLPSLSPQLRSQPAAAKVRSETQAPEAEVSKAGTSETSVSSNDLICSNCGSGLKADARVCYECNSWVK